MHLLFEQAYKIEEAFDNKGGIGLTLYLTI